MQREVGSLEARRLSRGQISTVSWPFTHSPMIPPTPSQQPCETESQRPTGTNRRGPLAPMSGSVSDTLSGKFVPSLRQNGDRLTAAGCSCMYTEPGMVPISLYASSLGPSFGPGCGCRRVLPSTSGTSLTLWWQRAAEHRSQVCGPQKEPCCASQCHLQRWIALGERPDLSLSSEEPLLLMPPHHRVAPQSIPTERRRVLHGTVF